MKRGERVHAKTGIGVQSERSWGNMEEDGGRGNRRDGELTYCSCRYSHHHHCLIWMLWMGFLDVSYHKVDTLFFFSFLLFSSLLFSFLLFSSLLFSVFH